MRSLRFYTYFGFSETDRIWKIGRSSDIENRAKQLKVSMEAVFPMKDFPEKQMHQKFARWNIAGEWFKDCRDIRAFLDETRTYQVDSSIWMLPKLKKVYLHISDEALEIANRDASACRRKLGNYLEQLVRTELSSPKPSK